MYTVQEHLDWSRDGGRILSNEGGGGVKTYFPLGMGGGGERKSRNKIDAMQTIVVNWNIPVL